jgi:hypothetical protein
MVSSRVGARVISSRGTKGFDLGAIFDFPDGLVHGRLRNICPPSDARPNACQTTWKRS